MKSSGSSNQKLAGLDAVRGIAILSVIVAHFVPVSVPHFEAISVAFGNFGVILFFFLSGFLMDRNLAFDPSIGPYSIRRAFRILPMYWTSLLVVMLMSDSWTAAGALANAAFVAPVVGVERMSGVYWTLYIEVLFYVLAPLLRYCGERTIGLAPYLALAVFAAIMAVRGHVNAALFYLIYCFAGMQISAWWRGKLGTAQLVIATVVVAIASAIIPAVSPYLGLAPLICVAAICWTLQTDWTCRPLQFFGLVSYSWYLLHATIFGYGVSARVQAMGFSFTTAQMIGIATSLAISAVTFVVLERPAIRLGKAIIARIRQPALRRSVATR